MADLASGRPTKQVTNCESPLHSIQAIDISIIIVRSSSNGVDDDDDDDAADGGEIGVLDAAK